MALWVRRNKWCIEMFRYRAGAAQFGDGVPSSERTGIRGHPRGPWGLRLVPPMHHSKVGAGRWSTCMVSNCEESHHSSSILMVAGVSGLRWVAKWVMVGPLGSRGLVSIVVTQMFDADIVKKINVA